MKKYINKTLYVFVFLTFLVSCSSDSDTFGLSSVTNYPVLTLNGSDPVLIDMSDGGTFTDPGVVATEDGQTIDYSTEYSSGFYRGLAFSATTPDKYQAVYSAINQDGFSGSLSRNIFVYNTGDFSSSIEGLYTSTVVRNNVSGAQYTNMKYVIIWKNSDGTYGFSDAIGGYYDMGRSYGSGYASKGMKVAINDLSTNDFTITSPSAGVGTFGGSLAVSGMTVNTTNKTINFTSTWSSGYTFVVTLTQVN